MADIIQRAQDKQALHRRELVELLGEQYAGHEAVTPEMALMLERVYSLRRAYLDGGRAREAHGVAQALKMIWHSSLHKHRPPAREMFHPTLPMGLHDEHS